ncbi:MAG: hypothetical protein BRC22_00765 [Parcubacteria group bacterium QH_9_35_7]|nr:MAG: hypothetical protein BRC22_00765 [Parcubacteria group bacterium QH_9_35_7]
MLNVNKHRATMVKIIKDIYKDKELQTLLGFKGGTAAMLFYGLPRFSVDLDFDILGEDRIDLVDKKVGEIARKYGEIKDEKNKYYNIFFLLSYGANQRNIKVEISKRDHLGEFEPRDYMGISMMVMKKPDMFANKLLALTERKDLANRDIFDIWYFANENWGINDEIIKERKGISIKEQIKNCIGTIEGVNNRFILAGLGELLEEDQKQWAKEELKEETIFLLRNYLEEIK